MGRIRTILSITILALFLGSCAGPAHHYRYKMTVVIETPDGVVTGSSVRELRFRTLPTWTSKMRSFSLDEEGEAVLIELSDDRELFVLLDQDAGDWVQATVGWMWGAKSLQSESIEQTLTKVDRDRDIFTYAPKAYLQDSWLDYPKIVYFEDKSDPKTIQVIEGGDLEATLGEGYFLKSITIVMTDEPTTKIIDDHLPKYGPKSGFSDWHKSLPSQDSRNLTLDRFTKGFDQ